MLGGDSTSGNKSTEISQLEVIEKFKIYWKVLTANAKSWINYWHVLRGAWRPDLWPNLYVLLGFHEADESSTFDRRPCHRGSRFFKHRLGCVFLMGEWQGQVPRIGDSFSICRSKRGRVHAHPCSSGHVFNGLLWPILLFLLHFCQMYQDGTTRIVGSRTWPSCGIWWTLTQVKTSKERGLHLPNK